MNTLNAKRLIVMVSGGIAAYKSPELVRRLRDHGAEVRVVMTPAATEFITPLTLQAVSGHEVRTALFDESAEAAMGHIELARWADAIVVAPATADFLARLSAGRADDLATAICLASASPILVAPAMNQQMWQQAATQTNLSALRSNGVHICGPDSGSQACGDVGPGRMVDPDNIVVACQDLFAGGALADTVVVITAGPTREAIDPVRYITNHSSGRMGYAIAEAARAAGAEVILISGPTNLDPPEGARCLFAESAEQMHQTVFSAIGEANIFVATAAVADYRPARPSTTKLKRDGNTLTLEMVPNPDILADVAKLERAPFTVGFAAETDNLADNARLKLERKGVDMVAANLVGGAELGFNTDDNALTVFWRGGEQHFPRAHKRTLSRQLIELVAARYKSR
ncbi:MAG: bifunctional phosphopantothenoylcysteine decarboxylase/phosphopantothenate--cysteine ligase CoaBC [Gammaproteobacteria bacterium]